MPGLPFEISNHKVFPSSKPIVGGFALSIIFV